jgi:hypothetical protein
MLLGLVLPRVHAFIGIMPRLSTIVANVREKFFRLRNLWLGLAILEISQRLMLGRGHSLVPRCG